MATTSDLSRVTSIVLRYMRGPILLLVTVYGVGIMGMSLMPGLDAEGNPAGMNLFHSFYFFTYTATTTGFGEIPQDFSDQQRLWAILCLYVGVIAWLYAIGSIIQLIQNPHFITAVAERRFARTVKTLHEPFVIICGFGDTGSLLARGLSDNLIRAVVIDSDPERIKALAMRDYRLEMPGLCGDASVPKHLLDAGIKQPLCRAVIALIPDEELELKIAVMTRFLNPKVRIICRATDSKQREHLRCLESVSIIDPFELFGVQLSTAITAPKLHNLSQWLVGASSVSLDCPRIIPPGNWILCGYGRMGRWLQKHLNQHHISTTIIDPDQGESGDAKHLIRSHTDHQALISAGIEGAVGLVAGTGSDSSNLQILLSAGMLNPDVFRVVRQNQHENEVVFSSAEVGLTMQPSLLAARTVLLQLISPMAQQLLEHLRNSDSALTDELVARLRHTVGDRTPQLWVTRLTEREAPAVAEQIANGRKLRMQDLLRAAADRHQNLACTPLAYCRAQRPQMMPSTQELVQTGDEILFCGDPHSRLLLEASLNNSYILSYLITGVEPPRGLMLRWIWERFELGAARGKG